MRQKCSAHANSVSGMLSQTVNAVCTKILPDEYTFNMGFMRAWLGADRQVRVALLILKGG